jgi:type IV secretion system protein VirD4
LGSTLDYRRLLPDNRDHGRLLLRGTAGLRTEIPDWAQFVRAYDAAVKNALRRGGHGDARPPRGLWESLTHRHQQAVSAARGGPR